MLFMYQVIAIATIWLKIILLMPKYPAIEMKMTAITVLANSNCRNKAE
jgi:hypothetical protein